MCTEKSGNSKSKVFFLTNYYKLLEQIETKTKNKEREKCKKRKQNKNINIIHYTLLTLKQFWNIEHHMKTESKTMKLESS